MYLAVQAEREDATGERITHRTERGTEQRSCCYTRARRLIAVK